MLVHGTQYRNDGGRDARMEGGIEKWKEGGRKIGREGTLEWREEF